MKHVIALTLLVLPVPALAQDVSGSARAADGDSLDFGGIAVRLYGIDAPELAQGCERGGANWACGKEAAAKLTSLVSGRQTSCEQRDIDTHGRTVADCRAGGTDLAGAMVDAGLAVALPDFTDRYVAQEARARSSKLGLWARCLQIFALRIPAPTGDTFGHRARSDRRPARPRQLPISETAARHGQRERLRSTAARPATVRKWTAMATVSRASPIAGAEPAAPDQPETRFVLDQSPVAGLL